MTETEKALRDALRARGEAYPVSPDAWARVQSRAAARRARRRAVRIAAVPVAAAAAAIGIAASFLAPGLFTGDDARPRAAAAAATAEPGDAQVAETLPRLCARDRPVRERLGLLPRAGALPTFGGGGWLVAVGDGAGGVRLVAVTVVEGRLVCRANTAAPGGGRRFVDYGGERGRGEVSWTGVTAPGAAAFEARYRDGTRMRFACGGETAGCVRRATVEGRVTVFTTKPRMYTPPKAGAPVHGEFTVLDTEGKVLERLPFSTE
ncbi:hypothetical protein [Actinomadura sp. 9N215]|uniref:hypothetical protein n=1 Tax=Actinomadura sp. 9N215 TaxID=3375150 RepID=UPI00379B4E98